MKDFPVVRFMPAEQLDQLEAEADELARAEGGDLEREAENEDLVGGSFFASGEGADQRACDRVWAMFERGGREAGSIALDYSAVARELAAKRERDDEERAARRAKYLARLREEGELELVALHEGRLVERAQTEDASDVDDLSDDDDAQGSADANDGAVRREARGGGDEMATKRGAFLAVVAEAAIGWQMEHGSVPTARELFDELGEARAKSVGNVRITLKRAERKGLIPASPPDGSKRGLFKDVARDLGRAPKEAAASVAPKLVDSRTGKPHKARRAVAGSSDVVRELEARIAELDEEAATLAKKRALLVGAVEVLVG